MYQKTENKINYIGEFKDRLLEKKYLKIYIDSTRKATGIIILTMGIIYFLVGFVDLAVEENKTVFLSNIMIRGGVLLLSIFSAIVTIKGKKTKASISIMLSVFAVLVLSYQFILFLYDGQNFLQQSMTYLLMTYAIFLIPGRWIYSVCFSISISILFFAMSPLYISDIPSSHIASAAVCIISAIILGAATSYNLNKHRRLQYLRERLLEISSNTDSLTNIYNRQKFDEILQELFDKKDVENEDFAIIMYDLDDFKKINDIHGHLIGDKVLISCTDAISINIRSQEVLARWGGEEFMLLLPNTHLQEAGKIAEHLRATLESLAIEDTIVVTASFGVTCVHPNDTIDTMVTRVDDCLYSAKHSGKNCVVVK